MTILILFPIGFFLIIRLGHRMVKDHPIYRPATEFLSSNPLLLERIGSLETFDVIRWSIQEKELPCTAHLRFTVKGSRGEGKVDMNFMSTNQIWHMQSATFVPNGSSSSIELVDNAAMSATTSVTDAAKVRADRDPGVLFSNLLAAAFIVWLFVLYSVIQMARLRTPGVRLWRVSVFDKSTLSPEAWPYRIRAMIAGVVFLILIFSIFIVV